MIGVAVGACGYALAQRATAQDQDAGTRVRVLLEQVLKEKLDGKEAKVTMQEVTLAPGATTPPHHHPGPVVVYVLEGELESQIGDQELKVYKKGDVFYEPTGARHAVARNPSQTAPLRFLAVILSPKDAKQLLIPEK
jgi:quercetin dioxygenase-like cupin family protein